MWYMSVTLVLRRLEQKDHNEFQAILGYRMTPKERKGGKKGKEGGRGEKKERKGKAFGRIGVIFVSSHEFLVVKMV